MGARSAALAALALAGLVLLPAGCGDEPGSGRNTAPSVRLRASMSLVKALVQVEFTAEGSDAEDNIVAYSWDFGDGSGAVGPSPVTRHAFPKEGAYLVSVTATDAGGLSATDELWIETTPPGGAPLLTVEAISFQGVARDATACELTVNGGARVPVEDGIFVLNDRMGSSGQVWSFEVIDRGGNSSACTVALVPVQ